MRLWVYLKSSGQLQYIITSQREGEREGKEERERRGLGNVTDCLRKIDCQKMAGSAVKLKMPPAGSERERGGRTREVSAPAERDEGGGIGEASVESCQT